MIAAATNSVENLDYIVNVLNSVYGLPSHMLVGLSCIIVGYVLRFVKRFPTDAIPLVSILWGMVFNPLMADVRVTGTPLRLWLVRHILLGLVIGAGAWVFHRYFLKRLEERLPVIKDALAEADRRSDEHQIAKITGKADVNNQVDGGK